MNVQPSPQTSPADLHGPAPPARGRRRGAVWLLGLAAVLLLICAACVVIVPTGTALVLTDFGRPVRFLSTPGLAWKLPAPLRAVLRVDLRLRVVSSALQEVRLRDGQTVLLQVFAAWQAGDTAADLGQFVRATRNDSAAAAQLVAGMAEAALAPTASQFAFGDFVNADATKLRLDAFEARLSDALAAGLRRDYGIVLRQIGIERLELPAPALMAAEARQRSELETASGQRGAEAAREAAQIGAEAARDSRILLADAGVEAAAIEAGARREAAELEQKAYAADPQLYTLLRSLDALGKIVGSNTRLVLRTDAAPFAALVAGPPATADSQK